MTLPRRNSPITRQWSSTPRRTLLRLSLSLLRLQRRLHRVFSPMNLPADPSHTSAADRAAALIMALAPEQMRESFEPMVIKALASMPLESVERLANDLESTHNDDGSVNVDRLVEVGKSFGLTDEMIAGYQASYGALA